MPNQNWRDEDDEDAKASMAERDTEDDDAEAEVDCDADWADAGLRVGPAANRIARSLTGWPVSRDGERVDFPDFIRPDYPFDLPPYRIPFAQDAFSEAGAHRFCPQRACRRAQRCRGGEGPPCFRADRWDLRHVLALSWMLAVEMIDEAQFRRSLRDRGNRYSQFAPVETPKRR